MSNPSTFLDLCKRTARECGVAGDGPASVTGQSGEYARIVNWVTAAYSDILAMHMEWDFLWGEDTLTLSAGVGSYTEPFTNKNVRQLDDGLFCYDGNLGVDDRSPLTFVPYRTFRSRYLSGARRQDKPTYYTIAPNPRAILVEPLPRHDDFRVVYPYWREDHTLSANTDTPLIPKLHRMVIVWRAVMMYAEYEEAANLYKTAQVEFNTALYAMKQSHLPKREIVMRPLA